MKRYIKPNLFDDSESVLERENRKIAYEMALEGIVLLKNENNALPLNGNKIALFGAGARYTIKGGTGSGEVNERYSVSIYDGLKNAGVEIASEKYLEALEADYQKAIQKYKDDMRHAMNPISLLVSVGSSMMGVHLDLPYGKRIDENDYEECDTAMYVITRQAGEGRDREIARNENDLELIEIDNIKFLASHFKHFILVLNVGSSMNLKPIDGIENISSIVFFAQQGEEGGNALATLVTGKVSFSGKLSSTWAINYDDVPFGEEFNKINMKNLDVDYKEGIYVGYRYFDSFNVPVRFPFGYGLSYSTFASKVTSVTNENSKVEVKVNVTNTGAIEAKEVIQVYVSFPKGKIDREYQSLVAYKKTKLLKSNETEELVLDFDLKDVAYFDEANSCYALDKGDYLVRVGNSSKDTKVEAVINLTDDVVVSKVEHITCPTNKVTQLVSTYKEENIDISNATKLVIEAKNIETNEVLYPKKTVGNDPKVLEVLNKLNTKQLIDLVVGCGFSTSGGAYMLPGAVGATTSKLVNKGLDNVMLCDGPAGVRILRRSVYYEKKNSFKELDHSMDLMNYLPKIALKFINGDPKKGKVVYQYTTAFPVGMSIAQSFNDELAYNFGKAISKEMIKFGVTYWLAPGMNIHRNPLCGRNYEYYSEDPFVSGMIAASVCKGVQETEGLYTTIKHYALNNNEANRNYSSSNVDERALREIYLRNFKIAIKEGKSKALMTSYNKVNNVYAANREDIVNKYLRDECGFDGVVMTDWFSTGGNKGNAALCIHAGNDLLMPGQGVDRRKIRNGLKNGECSLEELRVAAYNIIKQILEGYHHEEVMSHIK